MGREWQQEGIVSTPPLVAPRESVEQVYDEALERHQDDHIPCLNHAPTEASVLAQHGGCISFFCARCERVLREQIAENSTAWCKACRAEGIPMATVTVRPI